MGQIPQKLLPLYLKLSPRDKLTDLTHFTLKTLSHPLTIEHHRLLEILGGNSILQSLELEDFYVGYENEDDQDTERFVAQLPYLQFLSLKQCPSGAFLPRINMPTTMNVFFWR
jgi:hypothetical protein